MFASSALPRATCRGCAKKEDSYQSCSIALADRRDDILPLARRFLAEELRALGKSFTPTISESIASLLRSAPWPGNVRQLRSVCRFGATRLDSERELDLGDLPVSLTQSIGAHHEASGRARVLGVLARVDGNKAKAARILGITRPQLYRFLASDHDLPTCPDLQPPIASAE
jgi:DNA-binding NtrC family response regulator